MNFFVFESPSAVDETTTDYTIVGPFNTGPAAECSACGEPIELLHWLPPYRVKLKVLGDRAGDVVFGGPVDFLVSERFRDLYRSSGLSGLEGFDSVDVVRVRASSSRKHRGKLPAYYRVRATLGGAAVDDKASEIAREEASICSECRGAGVMILKRVVLEQGSWSGEDVFYARGLPGTILVSSRFVEFYNSNGLQGAVLIPALDYKYRRYGFMH
jgi:hypothetical protein